MVERSKDMAFAAGAMVFPGGRIDAQDYSLAAEIGTDAALLAAIRETLEETAIPVGISPAPSFELAANLQNALLSGEAFGSLLKTRKLSIEQAALTPFARWLPKFHAVRRFDTLFFVARCPAGDWQPSIVEGECSAAKWLTAAEILELEQSGAARLIFPTRRTLERLAQHDSFDAILNDAITHEIEPISPWVEDHEGEKFITIPANLGFPVTSEKLEGLWRG
jgi:8-oxo-dGTP pyrophosphatase MutT (NUDIX family)